MRSLNFFWSLFREQKPAESNGVLHDYRIFCCGTTGEDSIVGRLSTMIPLEIGHVHKINGEWWRCDWVGVNINYRPSALT